MTLSLALATTEIKDKTIDTSQLRVAREPTVANVTQCIYRPEDKIFGCRGGVDVSVECPTIFEWRENLPLAYKIFGLGVVPGSVDAKTELVRYWLYPRTLDNSTYFNHSLIVEGGIRELFLYYGEKFVEYGFRVTDVECFGRLIALIRGCSVEHMIPLESELDVKAVVPMVGEVLYFDKEVSKRWLYGYGFGLGYGGWGYGGLGYGYPYGIYGR